MIGFKTSNEQSGVYAYLMTPTDTTTPTTANEFTPIQGTFYNHNTKLFR